MMMISWFHYLVPDPLFFSRIQVVFSKFHQLICSKFFAGSIRTRQSSWVETAALLWRVAGGKFCLWSSVRCAFCPCGLPLFQLRDRFDSGTFSTQELFFARIFFQISNFLSVLLGSTPRPNQKRHPRRLSGDVRWGGAGGQRLQLGRRHGAHHLRPQSRERRGRGSFHAHLPLVAFSHCSTLRSRAASHADRTDAEDVDETRDGLQEIWLPSGLRLQRLDDLQHRPRQRPRSVGSSALHHAPRMRGEGLSNSRLFPASYLVYYAVAGCCKFVV